MSDEQFHESLVNELYDLALTRSKERWPIASTTLYNRMIRTALHAAYLKAYAGDHYIEDKK